MNSFELIVDICLQIFMIFKISTRLFKNIKQNVLTYNTVCNGYILIIVADCCLYLNDMVVDTKEAC